MLLVYCMLLEDPNRVDQEVRQFVLMLAVTSHNHLRQQLVSIPLLNAAESGHVEDVKLLLQHGADISQRNYYGLTGEPARYHAAVASCCCRWREAGARAGGGGGGRVRVREERDGCLGGEANLLSRERAGGRRA